MPNRVILLVEDNPDDEELTLRALRLQEITTIVVARDGQEALDWLFREGEHAGRDPRLTPIIVLLDINLPRVNGLDVLRRIRNHAVFKRLPVTILTSSGEPRDVDKAYANLANGFVTKPVDLRQFTETVGDLGRFWYFRNQPPLLAAAT